MARRPSPAWSSRLVLGAVAGAVAGSCMTAVHLVAKRAGAIARTSPEALEEWAARRGVPPPDGRVGYVAREQVLHLGYAAVWGTLLALAPRALRRNPAFGAAYGIVVWLLNFGAIVPGLQVASPFWRAPRGQNATGLVAHAAFGAVTSLALRDFAERPTPPETSDLFRRSVPVA